MSHRTSKKRKTSSQDIAQLVADEQRWSPRLIDDNEDDIAETIAGDKMLVELPGRMTMQHLFLSAETAGKANNKKWNPEPYDPRDYCLTAAPTAAELSPEGIVTEYLEVGIVIGSAPTMYKLTGDARNGVKEQERRDRGAIHRHRDALRAVIKVTPGRSSQGKFFVACKPVNGRAQVRSITIDVIFFYREHLIGITDQPITERHEMITASVRIAAARDRSVQTDEQETTPGMEQPSMPRCSITAHNNLLIQLHQHTSNCLQNGKLEAAEYQAMQDLLHKAAPMMLSESSNTIGLTTFWHPTIGFTREHAVLMLTELKRYNLDMKDICPDLVCDIRLALKKLDDKPSIDIGDMSVFLEHISEHVPRPYNHTDVDEQVSSALALMQVKNDSACACAAAQEVSELRTKNEELLTEHKELEEDLALIKRRHAEDLTKHNTELEASKAQVTELHAELEASKVQSMGLRAELDGMKAQFESLRLYMSGMFAQ